MFVLCIVFDAVPYDGGNAVVASCCFVCVSVVLRTSVKRVRWAGCSLEQISLVFLFSLGSVSSPKFAGWSVYFSEVLSEDLCINPFSSFALCAQTCLSQ